MRFEQNKTETVTTRSADETLKLARTLGARCKRGDLITLDGDLGMGKTLMTAGIAMGLGVKRASVSSPTYVIMKQYEEGVMPVYHWDFYRLASADELYVADFFELLHQRQGVFVVEWASMFKDEWIDYLPRYEVTLEQGDDHESRNITVINKR